MGTPLYDVSPIETPEQIEVHLRLAGIGSRAWAYSIDLLWQSVPILLAAFAVYALMPEHAALIEMEDGQPAPTLALQALLSGVVFVVNFGYFAFFETLWQGQTPGKRSAGLRVVKDGGHPIDGRAALLRNLLRAVDFLPANYVLGMGFVFVARQGKRLGDYAAGTLVIRDTPAQLRISAARAARGPLDAAQQDLLAGYAARREGLAPEARHRVAAALAARLAPAVGRPPPPAAQADSFLRDLEQLLRDSEDPTHARR